MQSFNLDCGRLDNTSGCAGATLAAGATTAPTTSSGGNVTKSNVAYLRTLSAPTPSPSHTIYQALLHNQCDNGTKATTCGGRQMLGQRNSLAGALLNATAAFDQHQPQNLTNIQSHEAATVAASNVTDVSNNVVDIKSTMSSAKNRTPMTILKIEETSSSSLPSSALAKVATAAVAATTAAVPAASANSEEIVTSKQPVTDVESLHQKRLRQLNMDMDNLRNTSIDQSQQLSALMQQNHYCTPGSGSNSNSGNKHKTLMTSSSCVMPKKASTMTATATVSNSSPMTCASTKQHQQQQQQQQQQTTSSTTYLLQHGSDATKKGSTSTIWTSEESILRSVGAVDEDNK